MSLGPRPRSEEGDEWPVRIARTAVATGHRFVSRACVLATRHLDTVHKSKSRTNGLLLSSHHASGWGDFESPNPPPPEALVRVSEALNSQTTRTTFTPCKPIRLLKGHCLSQSEFTALSKRAMTLKWQIELRPRRSNLLLISFGVVREFPNGPRLTNTGS